MREATGNALLVMMMTSIIAIIMVFFVGSISYSKSYRIKNYVINEIEENKGWNDTLRKDVIDPYLKDVGYSLKNPNKKNNCPIVNTNGNKCSSNMYGGNYELCVYQCGNGNNTYYKVISYMKFDFPVIGSSLKFKVSGETKTFNYFN